VPEGVAVVATGTWAALQAGVRSSCNGTSRQQGSRFRKRFSARYRAQPRSRARVRQAGFYVGRACSVKTVEAVYEFPFLATRRWSR